jgi:hypothetical protein
VVRTLLEPFFGGRLGKFLGVARHQQNIKIILSIHNLRSWSKDSGGCHFSKPTRDNKAGAANMMTAKFANSCEKGLHYTRDEAFMGN